MSSTNKFIEKNRDKIQDIEDTLYEVSDLIYNSSLDNNKIHSNLEDDNIDSNDEIVNSFFFNHYKLEIYVQNIPYCINIRIMMTIMNYLY